MSDYFRSLPRAPVPEPRDSALGILLCDDAGGGSRILFGRRSRKSRFMPGHLAFPGGRMDVADEPEREGAWARCASRELEEETGIRVAATDWIDVGERITPPMFPVRYRTRFFVAPLPDGPLPETLPCPDEIDALRLARPDEVLAEWARGETLLPPPVLAVLRAIERHPGLSPESLAERLVEANALEQSSPRVEFVPDVWVVPVRTRTIPPATHTNVWLPGDRRFVVIDPGSDEPEEIERLAGVVERRRQGGGEALAVVLSHHHPDHVAGAVETARRLRLPLWAHPATFERLEIPGDLPVRELAEGDSIDLGRVTLQVWHTPGHAPGHLAFEVPERGCLISGDLVSGLSTILIHPSEGDMEAYLASLDRVREAGIPRMLPSHGPPLPLRAVEKLIAHRLEREGKVRSALAAEGRPLAEIAREAYDDAPSEMPTALTEAQALAHLLHLERRGLARRAAADPARWLPGAAAAGT